MSIFFILSSFTLFGQFDDEQERQIDSLNKIINKPNTADTVLADCYLNLSGLLYVSNMDTMIPLCNKVIQIAKKGLSKELKTSEKKSLLNTLSGAYNNIGYIHMIKGHIDESLEYLHKSLEIVEELGDKEGLATGINNIGYIYNKQGYISKALDYFHRSLRIEEELNNEIGIATSLNNIASIYKDQGDFIKAKEYYKKSLVILTKLNNQKGIASVNNSIGAICVENGDIELGMQYYFKSLEIQKEIEFKEGESNCLNNIGYAFFLQNDMDKALEYYYQSLDLREQVGDMEGIVSSSLRISKALINKGEYSVAKKYALKGYEASKEIGFPKDIKFSAKLLSEIYEKENNKSAALDMLKLFVLMNDSINNEETERATLKQQAKYEYEKQKVKDDAEHDKQLAIEQKAKEKQQILTYASAIGLGLTGVFLFFVFNRLKVTRKQKNIIEEAHHELEEKNQEIIDSIAYAKRIQSAILPPNKIVKEYLQESFVLYKPKDIVAGDFYWLEHRDNKVLFAAADCTGHGVPGAMVSVVCNNGLNRSVREHGLTEPGKILDKTREIVIQEFEKSEEEVKDGMDIALCSLEGNKLQYAGAHNPLWIIRNGEIIETKANKQPIGKFDNPEPYTTHDFDLLPKDTIYIFTDGYVDQFGGEKGKKFKAKAFRDLLLSIQDKSMEEQKKVIDEAFETWRGDLEQIDDVCVIGIKI